MRLFINLKARILKSSITWSAMGKQTAQTKEVLLRRIRRSVQKNALSSLLRQKTTWIISGKKPVPKKTWKDEGSFHESNKKELPAVTKAHS